MPNRRCPRLLSGEFTFDDGSTLTTSTDQHPFAYFLLLGGLIRLAGESDLVLRFPSAAAATLLVPAAWAMARLLARRRAVPPATPALGRRVHGAEPIPAMVRPGSAHVFPGRLFSRWSAPIGCCAGRRRPPAGAPVSTSPWYALASRSAPLHALPVVLDPARACRGDFSAPGRRRIAAAPSWPRSPCWPWGWCSGLMAASSGSLQGTGSGTNFSRVSLPILAADLLNAFSLGLSVDIAQVRWLDYTFGIVAIVGAALGRCATAAIAREAWLLPAW